MKFYNIMNLTDGDIVKTCETREEAEEWIAEQDIPEIYGIIEVN